jgi:intein-encoded DNA endonuclease-like protein
MNIDDSKAVTGVFFIKSRNKWLAQGKYKGKNNFLGYFGCVTEAIKARTAFVKKHLAPDRNKRQQFERNIIELYESGKTQREIAKSVDRATSCVCEILKKHGRRGRSNKSIIDENKMLELYRSGRCASSVAAELGVAQGTISSRLKSLGVKVRPNRKYFFDQRIFEKIDCEWKAYFLGLLYADGYVGKLNITIRLHERDRTVLEKLCTIIYGNLLPMRYTKAKTHISKNGKVTNISANWGFNINSKKCVNDIAALGCHKAKSLTLKFPGNNIIPTELFCHFIRGYFDGDGSTYHSKKSNSVTLSIISSTEFCIGFCAFLQRCLNVPSRLKPANKVCRVNVSTGTDVEKFYNYIYAGATIFMPRKKEKMAAWLTRIQAKRMHQLSPVSP